MRVDKFLQVSRLVRRRAVATRLCDAGRVTLNGRPVKAASPVHVGDVLGVAFGARRLAVRVLQVPEGRPTAQPAYEVLDDRRMPDVW
ncbi:MAG: RNA-binding S4 domain-containing protein [Armatimonadota bacterium]|nr:RNA-binding S4 domain-containing protein [Armatimonadota bacterium]MDR7533791.1 RNA-binding S4 domain-containing protein [Armatimonadota bacterium]MDR7536680.1 RNA-binding S4 domain-containing protein [Armatimonadota bacterium]